MSKIRKNGLATKVHRGSNFYETRGRIHKTFLRNVKTFLKINSTKFVRMYLSVVLDILSKKKMTVFI